MANYKWIRPGKHPTGRFSGNLNHRLLMIEAEAVQEHPQVREVLDALMRIHADREGLDEVELHGIELSGVTYLPKKVEEK